MWSRQEEIMACFQPWGRTVTGPFSLPNCAPWKWGLRGLKRTSLMAQHFPQTLPPWKISGRCPRQQIDRKHILQWQSSSGREENEKATESETRHNSSKSKRPGNNAGKPKTGEGKTARTLENLQRTTRDESWGICKWTCKDVDELQAGRFEVWEHLTIHSPRIVFYHRRSILQAGWPGLE